VVGRSQILRGGVSRLVLLIAGASGLMTLIAVVYAQTGGHGLRTSVASALFIGGSVLVVGSAATGGGVRGQIQTMERRGRHPIGPKMPFGWVLVGFGVIAVGVLAVIA
jgi:hypothetical protein